MSTLSTVANTQAELAANAAPPPPPLNPAFPFDVAPFDLTFFSLNGPHPNPEPIDTPAPS